MKKINKILALLLAVLIMASLISCDAWNGDENSSDDGSDTPSTPSTPSTPNTPGENNTPEENMKLDNYTQPFWAGDTMYDESVMLIAKTDSKGNVIEAPRAKLLFEAEKIQSVTWYFHENNGSQIKTFTEGTDFLYEDGYIVAKGSIIHNDILEIDEFSTNMPYVTDKMLTGEQQFPGLTLHSDIPSKTNGLFLPFTEGYQIVQMQLSVTYTHAENVWEGSVPEYFGDTALSNTLTKLKNKEEVNLLVFGDSISTGANSSSVLGINPKLPTWPELFAQGLSSYYGGKVNLKNTSVGGWTSSNGVSGGTGWVAGNQVQKPGLAAQFTSGELRGYVPDIVIIGFGMNDASLGLSINTFCNNIISMINTIRGQNPDCEVILLGTMLANPMAKNQSKNQTEYTEYLGKLSRNYENVSVVDIGAMHQDLLDSGKYYTEMSSNNVNHPNDFFARVYAMNLLASVIDFDYEISDPTQPVEPTEPTESVEPTEPTESEKPTEPVEPETVYDQFIEDGYEALFADPFLKNGISVLKPDGNVSGTISGVNAAGDPSWVFPQWGSKYDIYDYAERNYYNGGDAFTYKSDGKIVDGVEIPAKILDIDSTDGSIYMELNAQVEYDHPRQDGESWPHTLLSQDFGPDLVHISELSDLVMNMSYEITKFEDCMGSSADSNKHCAQLVWYITLQNRTQGHADYGKYVWFGITLWDNRISGTASNGFAAEDAGKDDATHAFIYQPPSSVVHTNGKCPTVNEYKTVDFHLLEVAKTAFNTAKDRGYLGDTQWEDLYIGGMNFGFEVTGTYNVAVKIDSVGVYYK